MYILASKWFPTLIRQFFFSIDKIVFNFISQIYDLLITIARTSVLSQADILDMADRIYKLLAVFMIFKVTLSLITYVVNPDDFSDKSKGVSKLGMNIVISLSLLILTPYIFNYAYELQTIVLEDNSMATLIFGDKTDDGFLTSAGDDMAFMTMSPFFTPNVSIKELSECIELTKKDSSGNIVFNDACSGLDSSYKPKSNNENSLYALIKDSKNFDEKTLQNYVAGVENGSLGLMFREDMAIATSKPNNGEEVYVMEYKYIFSTVIGVVVCLLLITFCMDVGVRSIKLAFLQLVAPIPIISYVDPKSGKDGLFKKWYQMCFKTYISLFVRLLAIYFAVYIISMVADLKLVDIVDGSYVTNGFVTIFIIIGALMFAKQLPKILEGLGIKLDGDGKFMLNPLKKIENEALGGKGLVKAARPIKGLATAGLVGGAAALTGQGFRGVGKAFSGAMKGEKFGKNFSSSYAAARARNKQVEEMKANGVTPGQVRLENFKNRFRGITDADKVNQVETKAKGVQSYYDNIKNQAIACDSNDNSYRYKKDANGNYIKDANGNRVREQTKSAKTISKELDEMKKTQINKSDIAATINRDKITSDFNQELADKAKHDKFLNDFGLDINNYNDKEVTENGVKRTITAKEQFEQDEKAAIESVINSRYNQEVDDAYNTAISQQKDAIKNKEADLEARINDLANNEVFYVDENGNEQSGTGVASADKVIRESKETMITLAKSVNEIGSDVDDKFEKMYVPTQEQIENDEVDVVKMMKQSKGAVAQTTSGKMSDIKDIAKYTDKPKG